MSQSTLLVAVVLVAICAAIVYLAPDAYKKLWMRRDLDRISGQPGGSSELQCAEVVVTLLKAYYGLRTGAPSVGPSVFERTLLGFDATHLSQALAARYGAMLSAVVRLATERLLPLENGTLSESDRACIRLGSAIALTNSENPLNAKQLDPVLRMKEFAEVAAKPEFQTVAALLDDQRERVAERLEDSVRARFPAEVRFCALARA